MNLHDQLSQMKQYKFSTDGLQYNKCSNGMGEQSFNLANKLAQHLVTLFLKILLMYLTSNIL